MRPHLHRIREAQLSLAPQLEQPPKGFVGPGRTSFLSLSLLLRLDGTCSPWYPARCARATRSSPRACARCLLALRCHAGDRATLSLPTRVVSASSLGRHAEWSIACPTTEPLGPNLVVVVVVRVRVVVVVLEVLALEVRVLLLGVSSWPLAAASHRDVSPWPEVAAPLRCVSSWRLVAATRRGVSWRRLVVAPLRGVSSWHLAAASRRGVSSWRLVVASWRLVVAFLRGARFLVVASRRGVSPRRLFGASCCGFSSRSLVVPPRRRVSSWLLVAASRRGVLSWRLVAASLLCVLVPRTESPRHRSFDLSRLSRSRLRRRSFETEAAPPANQNPPPTLLRSFAAVMCQAKATWFRN